MAITDYHAKYYAHELSKRCSSDSLEKLTGTLMDAQVDLNPHQVEAALFAFKSPLSNGAILADEVGLGKTIEAGLLLSQKWAEGKRRMIIIVPASLRKQWNQELADKFFLPSHILEAKSYNAALKSGKANPFEHPDILICSYPFAARHAEELMLVPWDLVVLDEAHRLRNVYKPQNKTAKALRTALVNVPKVLLTATPLQNSLMELYGLVSFIDEYAFGDKKSFRAQYSRITSEAQYEELKTRLKPLCHRTLRRQVMEYVKYTNRQPITQEFWPSQDEQDLYDMVSDYLQRSELCALPNAQRKLMTLVMRKLLASSTFAIAGALDSLVNKLHRQIRENQKLVQRLEAIEDDFELLDEYEDELGVDEEPEPLTEDDIAAIENEIEDLTVFRDLAVSITENAKGLALLDALESGFAKARELGAKNKAIIFTESRRTQNYLVKLLGDKGYGDNLVLFNGSNNDAKSKEIYKNWIQQHQGSDRVTGSRTADMRAALVDYFRNEAQIMIATEAAAEGINLQFCSLLVNYDLPWNPQRIEQRIGRCHRYGQKYDVVVINFLNKANAADQRVYELLNEKFSLFSGVFGASDEVLGAIESGIDFENRIVEIYQTCREPQQIEFQFESLQEELDDQISEAMDSTRQKLLENFDAEVHDKLKVNLEESKSYLDKFGQLLWKLTRHGLADYASFDLDGYDGQHRFHLNQRPSTADGSIPLGHYEIGKNVEDAHIYRVGHPLAQHLITEYGEQELGGAGLVFDYSNHPQQSQSLEPLIGQRGYLALYKLLINGTDSEDHLVFIGKSESGTALQHEQIQRLFDLPSEIEDSSVDVDLFEAEYQSRKEELLGDVEGRYAVFFEQEMDKLDNWADDKRKALKGNLKDFDGQINELKKLIRSAKSLPEKLAYQRRAQKLEKQRDEAWREYDQQAREIEDRKDGLLDTIEAKLQMDIQDQCLFAIKWAVI
ncbi:MAG: DEAD/DEAH box helicase [Candidatus Thiodiazotropha endolucinida]|nr:DEAD/DEAH box helicase [Candidatus Thiodiazotropha taylori]MCW4261078.1 DEAD/DEAH box helicase [Candidatus Thiodiazotropha endolucinida]MCG8102342.1 DEAD/DEAH box helicase [Candidatus Thiodiazotropha taylori]MCG8120896.1 DEAD/DEAH box helicase [Candidatus Thiodiazotropha taylori]MCW4287665.1 DEAD/DEAH box helicase [Candidatus Thiodiazotropha endolucinida]